MLATLKFDTVGAFSQVGSFALLDVIAVDSTINPIGVGVSALQVTAVPEPATIGLVFADVGMMGVVGRRQKKAVAKGFRVEVA